MENKAVVLLVSLPRQSIGYSGARPTAQGANSWWRKRASVHRDTRSWRSTSAVRAWSSWLTGREPNAELSPNFG